MRGKTNELGRDAASRIVVDTRRVKVGVMDSQEREVVRKDVSAAIRKGWVANRAGFFPALPGVVGGSDLAALVEIGHGTTVPLEAGFALPNSLHFQGQFVADERIGVLFGLGVHKVGVNAPGLLDAAEGVGGDLELDGLLQQVGVERFGVHVRIPRPSRLPVTVGHVVS